MVSLAGVHYNLEQLHDHDHKEKSKFRSYKWNYLVGGFNGLFTDRFSDESLSSGSVANILMPEPKASTLLDCYLKSESK